jgi:hypothetical protein
MRYLWQYVTCAAHSSDFRFPLLWPQHGRPQPAILSAHRDNSQTRLVIMRKTMFKYCPQTRRWSLLGMPKMRMRGEWRVAITHPASIRTVHSLTTRHYECLNLSVCVSLDNVDPTNSVCRVGAVGIATRYGLDGPEIEPRWEWDFLQPSKPALGPTILLYNGYRVSFSG